MEELIRSTFGDWGLVVIPLVSGILSSLVIEAIDVITVEKFAGRYLLTIICVIIPLLVLFNFPSYYTKFISWEFLTAFILNICFAILFYFTLGKWFIFRFFDKLKIKLGKKIDEA